MQVAYVKRSALSRPQKRNAAERAAPKNKAEVDELDTWYKARFEREQLKATEGQGDQTHAGANARIAAMVRCSGLPWNGERR